MYIPLDQNIRLVHNRYLSAIHVGEESPLQVLPSMVLGGGAAPPAHNFVTKASHQNMGVVLGETPSQSSLPTKPFNGSFQGIFWNCRSLWARSSRQTIQFTRKLLGSCDFLALAETRQTPERKSELASLFPDCKTFASGIDQYKGGIAIIVKRTFLDMFSEHTWEDTIPGRVGVLRLHGRSGAFNMHAVYLDPSSCSEKMSQMEAIFKNWDKDSYNIIAADFNFVVSDHDRINKTHLTKSGANDKKVAGSWEAAARLHDIHEWQQSEFTCESSHAFSRIDCIYCDIPTALNFTMETHCATMPHPRHLSDHRPLIFGRSILPSQNLAGKFQSGLYATIGMRKSFRML